MAEATTVRREYETIYILKPDVAREVSEGVAARVTEAIKNAGDVVQIENWGRRRLAYPVLKNKRGLYVYFRYSGVGDLVSEVERTLRLQEAVMKFQTVKLTDETENQPAQTVAFQHIEELDEDEEETLAQSLGLEERSGRSSMSSDDEEAEAGDSDGDSDEGDAATSEEEEE